MKERVVSICLAAALLLGGCGSSGGSSAAQESSSGSSAAGGTALSADQSGMFTDRDLDAGYDESSAALVQLTGETAECGSEAVTISGGTVTITDEGTYLLSGILSDGMVIVASRLRMTIAMASPHVNFSRKSAVCRTPITWFDAPKLAAMPLLGLWAKTASIIRTLAIRISTMQKIYIL